MESFAGFILQHWNLFLTVGILTVLIIFLEIREHAHGIPRISTQEAVQLLNRDNALVIDVRDEALFKEGHILNALSMPVHSLGNRLPELEKKKENPIIFVCAAGNQSVHAAKLLYRHGFKRLYSLKGGMGAWRLADLPIKK